MSVGYKQAVGGLDAVVAARSGSEPHWLSEQRRDALARFAERGLPTTRQEDWKYTRVSGVLEFLDRAQGEVRPRPVWAFEEALAAAGLSSWDGPVAVFVDGKFAPETSRLDPLPAGLTIGNLDTLVADGTAALESLLSSPATPDDGFSYLNVALATDGAVVRIDKGTVCDLPVLLLFLSTAQSPTVHTRSFVQAGSCSQLSIAEIHADLGSGAYFANHSIQFVLAAEASVEHTMIQREGLEAFHVGRISASVGHDATFTSNAVSIGAALLRCDVQVALAQEGASCALNGLYLAHGSSHVDFHTAIDHAQPHTTSAQLYKGLLDGSATGVFNGKVMVRPQAQKTSARQVNRNLLLSPKAQINTKPQLEIFANDVKCSHGATIGQLDAAALFYLRSRGLSREEAFELLKVAFASEVVTAIGDERLQASVSALLAAPRSLP